MSHPIHMLWAHPRSVSTAFERIMRERGDVDLLHEPLMYYHYLHRPMRDFPGFDPDPAAPTRFEDIRDMLLVRAEERPVFVKDMAYYAPDRVLADNALLGCMTHAFLVRDPAEAVVSYAKIDPEFTSPELGINAQLALVKALKARDLPVHVILSDHLRRDPATTLHGYWDFAGLKQRPDALSWQAGTPQDWEAVKDWHGAVRSSTGIRPSTNVDAMEKLAALPKRYLEIYRDHFDAFRELESISTS